MLRATAVIILLPFFLASCAGTIPFPKQPSPPKSLKDSELIKAPLEERKVKSLPKETFGKIPMLALQSTIGDGVLLSPRWVSKLALIKTDRNTLRSKLLAERRLKRRVKYIYEKALYDAEVQYMEARPTWWERHSGKIGFISGMVIGVFGAIGMAYGISSVVK